MKKILSIMMLLTLAFAGTSCDDDDNNVAINDNVRTYINTHYPGAVILEAEYNYGYLEVDIYHDTLNKDVYFDNNDAWVKTTWDVAITTLPEAVTAAITTAYPDYRTDDAEYVETPDGTYYSIELEQGERDIYIKVTSEGTIL
ncbi:MAG: PepSY-like domain-containing protein [Bacteroidaceae bacterium]|nr:PepSY-like domain-containing protein [Bacteroidaceae bacterium]